MQVGFDGPRPAIKKWQEKASAGGGVGVVRGPAADFRKLKLDCLGVRHFTAPAEFDFVAVAQAA